MKDSKIEWTDHTLNFWWGCVKISPGCTNCYAATLSKRYGRDIWGPAKTTERMRTKGPWKDVLRWNKQAASDGIRRKVFCQSMSDFFEDHPQLDEWRAEAYVILESLKWLDVQLLTKRPENVLRMVPAHWLTNWPANIWIGTSVENQEYADKRIPELLKIPAAVRFLSVEPMLGPVDLSFIVEPDTGFDTDQWKAGHVWKPLYGHEGEGATYYSHVPPRKIDWVIVGGESGHGARPMYPQWARSIRDQCQEAGVPFLFKQWGHWGPCTPIPGNDPNCLFPWGKHRAGRLLDGREWNEYPAAGAP